MKEVAIARKKTNGGMREVVAFVNPRSLDTAGISEDSFREEVLKILAAGVLHCTVVDTLGDFFGGSDDSRANEAGRPERSLPDVQSAAMRSLLDDGIRVEIRDMEQGRLKKVCRLTITSGGIIEGH